MTLRSSTLSSTPSVLGFAASHIFYSNHTAVTGCQVSVRPHRPHPANPVYHSPRLGTSLRPILVIVTRGNVVCSPKHRTSDLGPVSNGKSWHGGHVSPLHHTCSIQRSSFERDTYPCNSGPCLILPFAPPVAPPLAHYLALMVQIRL